jgi:sigma-B regulation protein RsbQ
LLPNDVAKAKTLALILQSTDDLIAPISVGEYLHKTLPDSVLEIIDNVGHGPHLSAPGASVAAIERFLQRPR